MKEKVSFYLTNAQGELDAMARFFGNIEEIERIFSIEFAGGIENGVPLFYSKVQEDVYLSKYDGEVVEYMILVGGNKVVDARVKTCRFDITYDPDYRHNGSDKFSRPKVIIR